MFCEVLGGYENVFAEFCAQLDQNYTYFFELVSKYNKICVSYEEDAIYYLGRRNMLTFKEDGSKVSFPSKFHIKYPREYKLSSYEECQRAAEELGENQEGFVVVDGVFRRIKMKTPWYISMHRLRGNGVVTPTHILALWQSEAVDDFVAAFPEYTSLVDEVARKLVDLIERTDIAYEVAKKEESRKNFALRAQAYVKPMQACLFALLDKKSENAESYYKQVKPRTLAQLLDIKEINVK